MTNLVSGQPEMFTISYTTASGKFITWMTDTVKKAQDKRREIESMPAELDGVPMAMSPKGAVRIARFRGEWL
jgi:hypothetical protein